MRDTVQLNLERATVRPIIISLKRDTGIGFRHDQRIAVGRDNIVVIRKIFGKTKIILPIDVEISVSASSIYGRVQFLDLSFWDLRNESISIASPGYRDSHKRVKVVVNSLFGDVEVIRV